ncbi:peptidase family M48-domain-containing protein [Kalaharituber pfeilii]|nr:peptidase family M48-domain-containing protein [Kalaharituber pfeilii]
MLPFSPKDMLGRLAALLDIPLFPWKRIIIGFSAAQYLLESYLSYRQHEKLKGTKIPKALEGAVTQADFDKAQAYGRAKSSFGFIKGFIAQVENYAVIYYDVLPKIWGISGSFLSAYAPARFSGEISQSIVFFILFNALSTIMSIPTSYYSTFVIEEEFGFNKQTKSLFFTDIVKSQFLTAVLGAPVLAGFLKIIQSFGGDFFYYLWIFGITVQAFMITIYPIFILPFFNKLSPLEDGELKTAVEALARKLNFPLKHLYSIDGSKRSAHSNAYFYGLPWSKHIVIYDTLMQKSNTDEVVAVLAHELGHWSLSHTTKLFGIAQFHMFYIFALFSAFINNRSLYRAFGFYNQQPIIVGFILFGDLLAPMDTVVKLLMNILSRKFEYQADEFAVKLGYSADLAKSLIKLQIQNLATMDADWMYSSYHYTHPILPERLAALGWKGEKAK